MIDREWLGGVAASLALLSNGAYLVSVVRRKTRPHVFSWTIWGLVTGITFFAQRSADAGPGAWHMATNSVMCFSVAALAIRYGSTDIKRSDVIAFIGALLAIPIWYVTHQPLAAVVMAILVDVFAYFPTFRKTYKRPHEELAFTYTVDVVRCVLSIIATDSYSLTTLLYPAFVALGDGALVGMILYHRWRHAKLDVL